MLEVWGDNGGDTISEEEYEKVGHDTAMEYHRNYCWLYGFGFCGDCALDKHMGKENE